MAYAEQDISAPPEVVFNTATDPDRFSAWLPAPLRADGAGHHDLRPGDLSARWSSTGSPGFTAHLRVRGGSAGGATAQLDLEVEPALVAESATGAQPAAGSVGAETPDDQQLTEIAERSLASLASAVADNLTAG